MKSCIWFMALAGVFFMPSSLLAEGNWLENGSFIDGITHWYGDGRAPDDFKPENPLDKPDPFTSHGLIVPLKHVVWTKVAQDFTGKEDSNGILVITYMASPDLAFSTHDNDYSNMPDPSDYGYSGIKGECSIFFTNRDSGNEFRYNFHPAPRKSGVQTVKIPVTGLSPHHANTLTIEFPPGKGMIVFLSATLNKTGKVGP